MNGAGGAQPGDELGGTQPAGEGELADGSAGLVHPLEVVLDALGLRLELERAGTGNVVVTTFVPSYVSTGMFQGARGPLLTPIMRPEAAVRAAWSGMLAGTPIVARPWTVKLAMALRGVLPTRVWDLVADRVFKVYSSMDHFVGRS